MTAHEVESPTVAPGGETVGPVVGQFTWDTVADVWWWSDGLYQLYGYQPAAVAPTLELFLRHKDPADQAQIDLVFSRCAQEGGPFSCHHRIIDARGTRKTVVAIGFGHRNPADTNTDVMQGFLVEVGSGERAEAEEGLQAVLRSRASIEQVKGALMLTHGVTPDGAFHLLRGYSQVYNKKLAAIVAGALAAFHARPPANAVSRSELDRILWDAAQS
ncbi:PAS fold-containing protein [Friedmanniella luteola]|uniref:PAS fold-containing protein n=1 Tax=Friedmanniella luteola TaxID=546871 RepID=A0A1H1TCH1_9ACTN|nr:PAS and ANTAR domain-containing protein [Friedmanniella luteola]SDS58025.1 PAS fold-containing protein [Friedmanniella luteola]